MHSLSAVKTATLYSNGHQFRDPHDPYTTNVSLTRTIGYSAMLQHEEDYFTGTEIDFMLKMFVGRDRVVGSV